MGLKDKLETVGSVYSVNNGNVISPNPLSTKYSGLHYDFKNDKPGYSTIGFENESGTINTQVNNQYVSYNDGVSNPLPLPSNLDLDDLGDPKYKLIYGGKNKYENKTHI
jgi:hypothetical protein